MDRLVAVEKVIFHVDMDAFYAAVEQRDNPRLRGKPVIIGARPGTRGVVSACSYEARKYGVRSAMPVSEAFRKCPRGEFLPVRMDRYQEVSAVIMEIFCQYTPSVRQLSIDEAFLDMTGTERLFGPPPDSAKQIKDRVSSETECTLSIGVAANHYIAKLASDYDKPDGLYIVPPGKEVEFLDTLELKDLWGVGKKTLARMEELNITSIPKLRSFSKCLLESMFGKAAGEYLFTAVRGENPGVFSEEPKSKSVSNEITFPSDTRDKDVIHRVLLELSHQVMFRMMRHDYVSSTVHIKLRFENFITTTAQKTLRHHLHSAEEIYAVACEMMEKRWDGVVPIRLIGVGLGNVENESKIVQGELFEDPQDRQKRVEKAVLELKKKVPGGSVVKANLLGRKPRGKTN